MIFLYASELTVIAVASIFTPWMKREGDREWARQLRQQKWLAVFEAMRPRFISVGEALRQLSADMESGAPVFRDFGKAFRGQSNHFVIMDEVAHWPTGEED